MQTNLSAEYAAKPAAANIKKLLTQCVHCGYCSATCPTYQITGDELDSPRGRIYQIKRMLEGETNLSPIQHHLDRCLSCRNCETTCPSGVSYHQLLDFAKEHLATKNLRAQGNNILRWGLKKLLTSPFFHPIYRLGKLFQPFLPKFLAKNLGKNPRLPSAQISLNNNKQQQIKSQQRNIILLKNCLQRSLRPSVEQASEDFFALLGINCLSVKPTSCCGALEHHLDDRTAAIRVAKKNIDNWCELIERHSVEAIVITASACTLQIKEYPQLFSEESEYLAKAQQIASIIRDPCEYLAEFAELYQHKFSSSTERKKYVLHPPCTLQHGLRLGETLLQSLRALSWQVVLPEEAHLCCGSAGTYSILQKDLATSLAQRKITQLQATQAEIILTANIGCLDHLGLYTEKVIYHWLEAVILEYQQLSQ